MATESLLMQLIRQTWQISTALFPYLILAAVAAAAYIQRNDSTKTPIAALRYGMNTLLMERRQHIVYGTVLAGTILHIMPDAPVFAYTLAIAFYIHALFTTIEDPAAYEESENPYIRWTATLIYTAATLTAITSLVTPTPLPQTLATAYIYGIIFWNL